MIKTNSYTVISWNLAGIPKETYPDMNYYFEEYSLQSRLPLIIDALQKRINESRIDIVQLQGLDESGGVETIQELLEDNDFAVIKQGYHERIRDSYLYLTAYRRDRFSLVGITTKYLSRTPERPSVHSGKVCDNIHNNFGEARSRSVLIVDLMEVLFDHPRCPRFRSLYLVNVDNYDRAPQNIHGTDVIRDTIIDLVRINNNCRLICTGNFGASSQPVAEHQVRIMSRPFPWKDSLNHITPKIVSCRTPPPHQLLREEDLVHFPPKVWSTSGMRERVFQILSGSAGPEERQRARSSQICSTLPIVHSYVVREQIWTFGLQCSLLTYRRCPSFPEYFSEDFEPTQKCIQLYLEFCSVQEVPIAAFASENPMIIACLTY